jgi:hypothetical protein
MMIYCGWYLVFKARTHFVYPIAALRSFHGIRVSHFVALFVDDKDSRGTLPSNSYTCRLIL